jgi:riboflavin synthase
MFTGIVEEIGVVKDAGSGHLAIEARGITKDLRAGESIAINGACLTITSRHDRDFTVDISRETLRRTNLGGLGFGDYVNLERPLALGDRLSGHLVLGHVDDIGWAMSITSEESSYIVRIAAPREVMSYIAKKGFVAVDGVSLTVVELDSLSFFITLVPYTFEKTTFHVRRPGDAVNLEVDVLARYLDRLRQREEQELSLEQLVENGFLGRGS